MLINISDSGQTFKNLASRIMCFNKNKKQIKDFENYKGPSELSHSTVKLYQWLVLTAGQAGTQTAPRVGCPLACAGYTPQWGLMLISQVKQAC